MRFPVIAALVASAWSLAVPLAHAARAFVPGEFVWCAAHRAYVEAPHECSVASGSFWCDECQGYYSDDPHLHETATNAERPDVTDRPATESDSGRLDGTALPTAESGAGSARPAPEGQGADFEFQFLRTPIVASAVAVVAVVALLLFALRPRRKSAFGAFEFVRGKPQGVEIVPDALVCEREAAFDGGTALGYRALFRVGRRWRPAFVKRMVGAGMRQDVRFPALRFESDVLRRLAETSVVPRVLVPATETNGPDGKYWAFYAMSVAQGEPWPERGGLGRDNKAALHALCEALVALHERGIGHHDLKPQNVFWDARRKRVTLLDFGSAIDHSGSASALVNPLGATYPKTLPWVAPEGDGRHLADLATASDAWVYGLLFCEALVGGIHEADRTRRRSPEKPEDRDWLREALGAAVSPRLADAVVDGLFALRRDHRMALRDFLTLLREEWDV